MSTTVSHEIARNACGTVTTRARTRAPAASRPAITGGTTPVASRTIVTTSTARQRRQPRPSGTPRWRLRDESTAMTSGDCVYRWSASHGPRTSTASPGWSVIAPDGSSELGSVDRPSPRRSATTTRFSSRVVIPGLTMRPLRVERGAMTTSTTPTPPVNRRRGSRSAP